MFDADQAATDRIVDAASHGTQAVLSRIHNVAGSIQVSSDSSRVVATALVPTGALVPDWAQ